MMLAFFVFIQYRSVTDRHTDGQTDGRTERHCFSGYSSVYNALVTMHQIIKFDFGNPQAGFLRGPTSKGRGDRQGKRRRGRGKGKEEGRGKLRHGCFSLGMDAPAVYGESCRTVASLDVMSFPIPITDVVMDHH